MKAPKRKCRRCLKDYEPTTAPAAPPKAEEPAGAVAVEEGFCAPCIAARAAPVPLLDVDELFGKAGPFGTKNPKYEPRLGQIRLAKAIAQSLAGRRHFMGEGPCGIGKSLAYGVPAAHAARHGKRVLIVTASIALQEQLIDKDLPAIRETLGWDVSIGLMKGKSNYVCRSELETLGDGVPSDIPEPDVEAYRIVRKWADTTERGDKSELSIHAPDSVWRKFTIGTGECPGRACGNYVSCFSRAARERAAAADILVTNYHMLFLNMSYGGTLLPASDIVILDEAHEAADIARDVLGFSLGRGSFSRLAREAEKRGEAAVGREIAQASREVFEKLLRFHDSEHYKSLLRWPAPISPDRLVAALDAFPSRSHMANAAGQRAREVKEGLTLADENRVYSIEVKESRVLGSPKPQRNAYLRSQYVCPGPYLAGALWGEYQSAIAVSATITAEGKFDFARRELGAPVDTPTLMVETPFRFERQALLVVPPARTLPEPNDERFTRVASTRLLETIRACGGRTLALFTSYRAMNAAYDLALRETLTWPEGERPRLLRQGEAPTALLIKDFKLDHRSVLFGVTSFWTGIDVPGEALTGLVIDRLPFGSPDDPVTIRLAESDPQAFANYTVPKSILTFRQGVGRLIRSVYDVGVVVLLDKRVETKSYGSRFLRSLPRMRRADSTAAIRPFLAANGVAP